MLKVFKLNRRGFTLTELIVVIAILGVLAAVVTPSVLEYIADAEYGADRANAATLNNAVNRMVTKGTLKLDIDTYNNIADTSAKEAIKNIIKTEVNPLPVLNDEKLHFVLIRALDEKGACKGVSVQLMGDSIDIEAPPEGINVAYLE
jgi:prepilin-type N-terminal cleavage/methylation domain-containing protein